MYYSVFNIIFPSLQVKNDLFLPYSPANGDDDVFDLKILFGEIIYIPEKWD